MWLFWLEHMRKNEFEEKEIESLFQVKNNYMASVRNRKIDYE